MKEIRFDFNNLFSFSVGKNNGVSEGELKKIAPQTAKAHQHLKKILKDKINRVNLNLEWVNLPFQDKSIIRHIQDLGYEIASKFENVLFLGIGGSYLGLKAAQDALNEPYYNDFPEVRAGRPRIFFEGNNLDPDTLSVLLRQLDARKTFVVVISKSGETSETKAAFSLAEDWLKKELGECYGRQIIAITDPESGTLRKKVDVEQANDNLSFRNLPLLKGVGGRFSELNMGLLHLAIIGVDIQQVLAGAAEMQKRCDSKNVFKNPALMYAALMTILYRKKGKAISILMPFSETLKSTADWYVQLLAESLGKKYGRKIKLGPDGREIWESDNKKAVNFGRTPISARGTNDLHSIQQNNIEGENNKTLTFIKVEKFKADLELEGEDGCLCGKSFSGLINLAEEATEWALVKESRPNCCVILPEVNPYYWGGLIFFFELATAFEGELLNVNAFDQPGVEGYKKYMYYKLNKPGLSLEIAREIQKHPLVKNSKFIV